MTTMQTEAEDERWLHAYDFCQEAVRALLNADDAGALTAIESARRVLDAR